MGFGTIRPGVGSASARCCSNKDGKSERNKWKNEELGCSQLVSLLVQGVRFVQSLGSWRNLLPQLVLIGYCR